MDEYKLTTLKSTFLDIGSGFGKPNFHAALQIFPKESLGVEVVEARVSYSIDQKYKFEEYYTRLREKKQNIASAAITSASSLQQSQGNNGSNED